MRIVDQLLRLSATDLANHLACHHLSSQSLAVAEGRARQPHYNDPIAAILRERGTAHEAAYLSHLRRQSALDIVEIPLEDGNGEAAAMAAMRAGADLIYQAPLGNERWYGRTDFLRRIDRPSDLGDWSYEVIDAKLAAETRATTILQLCVYSELLAQHQGVWPDRAYVVAPEHDFRPEPHRLADYTAYYRLIRRRLEQAIERSGGGTYPDPVPHCEVCRWWAQCNARRRQDDHLCFVAGISRLQIRELRRIDVGTLERLARLESAPRPARGSRDALRRIHEQARIQLEARSHQASQYELLEPIDETHGLADLPEPSAADLFLDLEGDRLALAGGRDYLFGYVMPGRDYVAIWAMNPAEERLAFETVVDTIIETFRAHPDCHVYHFGAYEPTAFKRLAQRYATRESELDEILRAGLFVDLHTIVRHALRASVETYSIKELEQFYGLERQQDMRAATASRRAIEWAIELEPASLTSADFTEHLTAVERYNREDCVSTEQLRDWLEGLRAKQIARGFALPRPPLRDGAAGDTLEATADETQQVMDELLAGIPDDPDERTPEQQACWLMAHLLEWHRREDKAAWWEYFRLLATPLEDYETERSALAGLDHLTDAGGTAARPVHRYRFPAQDHDIRRDDEICLPGEGQSMGSVVAIDLGNHTIDIRHSGRFADFRPEHVFVRRIVRPGDKPSVLLALGRWIAAHGIDAAGPHRAARDLLLRRPPRLAPASGTAPATESRLENPSAEPPPDDEVAAACTLVSRLDGGVLPIQGPPGTGKTFTGSHMIVELARAGKRVGVTAVSHEVIRNLLKGAIEAAEKQGLDDFRCLHKGSPKDSNPDALHAINDNKRVGTAFAGGDYAVLGGTSWLWARPEFHDSVDVLFIDEAGQMSLADVLAVAAGARNLVLLGDPQQLEQPQQASHPPGTEASALEHILGGSKTIAPTAGIFLPQTRRLHPSICAFTAEVFYENRLTAYPGLENQAIVGSRHFPAAGLVYVPVEHEANQARALEEVSVIAAIVDELTHGVFWRNSAREEQPLTRDDIMIVAPYNAQVTALGEALPDVRAGTVDKFQGQQAPVVIVSLTTSAPDEAPRGMSFLYSANRLNVATSRAKALCILVGSRRLFEPDCRTPEQMRLANAFCRYLELARTVDIPLPDGT